ncbi:VRR-NUC domain-containing protein [Dyella japonica]|uniref:VRR-NUC domain-containing protein n=1 Tax=Dyella japonica A8 TaxID=1217721 RepID=A0A075K3L2_9GAMM|nr:VRR-NUC domain-containing protein [Dyella japonica]AIF48811.1 hypothetical protein HY57_16955 [Dyella japonica A8]
MAATLQPVDTTCTTVQERIDYAKLPPLALTYLTEKVRVALKAPKVVTMVLPDGSVTTQLLKQLVMSAAIRLEETLKEFLWPYKAEVSFDMAPMRRGQTPIPFLCRDSTDDPDNHDEATKGINRRHTTNPFPLGLTPGLLRRPDIIIVTNPLNRWPGRGTVDREGGAHAPNLRRLVEVKFPGDVLNKDQEEAYLAISGGVPFMSVLDVNDCEGDLEKVPVGAPAPAPQKDRGRQRAPIRSPTPLPDPAFYEKWLTDVEHAVQSLWHDTREGAERLWDETQAWLRKEAPWLFTAGHWVADALHKGWTYVDEAGRAIWHYTTEQLKAGWQAIKQATDLTWQQLKQIDWAQVGITVLKGLAVVVLVIAAVVVLVVLAEVLVAVLAALVQIIGVAAAIGGAAALAVALGEAA